VVVNADLPLWIAGIGVALAVPVTFMVANWVRKNVDHGEARFGPDGKVLTGREPEGDQAPCAKPSQTGIKGEAHETPNC
jgi:hypothetical protein